MKFTEFTLRIILIFLPGLISFIIVEKLTIHREIKAYRFFIYSFLLGFSCYSLYYPISLIPFLKLKFSFIESLSNNKLALEFKEIFIATFLSFPIGFLISFFINRKVLHRIAQKLKITNKFGDIDVWSYIMNSEIDGWVVIRDIENDLMYEGWIQAYSDSTERDELFLRDVKVFTNSTAQVLYETNGLYLPRRRENISIEFPSLVTSENSKKQTSSREELK